MFLPIKTGDHGSRTEKKAASTHNSAGNKIKMTAKKRKSHSNVDDGDVKPKKLRKLDHKKDDCNAREKEANIGTVINKKDVKRSRKMTFNSRKDYKIMRTKKRLDTQKKFGQHKGRSPNGGNRTESLDKKHEARRKRRAKGKVHVQNL